MDNAVNKTYRFILVFLFFVSMVALGLEIILTRVFSVVLFSSHSFMAISLALLGTGSGAIIAYLGKPLSEDKLKFRLIIVMALMAIFVSVSLFTLLQIEFVPLDVKNPITGKVEKNLSYKKRAMMLENNPDMFKSWKMFAGLPLAFFPFLLAGYLQALVFRFSPKNFGKMYGIDLIGATVGSLAIPLLLYPLGLVGAIGFIVLLCLVPIAYAWRDGHRGKWVKAGFAAPILIFAILSVTGFFGVQHSAGFREKDVIRSYWSPFARVALVTYKERQTYIIDNSSRTYYVPKTKKFIKKYDNCLYNIPFRMKSGGSILIIASGGGQEITMASHYNFKNIDAVEIAGPIVRDILNKRKNDPNNPYLLPGVTPHIADGRSVAMRAKEKYDIIEMLEVNCWTLAGQISQAWSPYFVFTQEAFSEYLDHLKDDGYLAYTVFSNSANPVAGNKGRRLRSVVAGMRMFGIKNPLKHIVILQRPYVYGHRTMVMAKKKPFTIKELKKIRKGLEKTGKGSELLFPDISKLAEKVNFGLAPDEKAQPNKKYLSTIRRMIRQTVPLEGLFATINIGNYMDKPISDDRPYIAGSGLRKFAHQGELFIGQLYKSLLKVMGILATIFIILPFVFRRPSGGEKVRIDPRLLLILVLTGFGFMYVEMAGIYRYQLYLHHPVMAMILVLSSTILGAGLGSLHSASIPVGKRQKSIAFYAALAAVIGAILPIWLPIVAHKTFLMMPMFLLASLTFAAYAAAGFVLGHIVPLAISAYSKDQENLMAWCWAITVTGSVFGTVTASIISRDWGMILVGLLGVACYAGVVIVSLVGIGVQKLFTAKANKAG